MLITNIENNTVMAPNNMGSVEQFRVTIVTKPVERRGPNEASDSQRKITEMTFQK